jgi:hypothetical protein
MFISAELVYSAIFAYAINWCMKQLSEVEGKPFTSFTNPNHPITWLFQVKMA